MSGSAVSYFYMNGKVFATKIGNTSEGALFSIIVPAGATYRVDFSGAVIAQWFELR